MTEAEFDEGEYLASRAGSVPAGSPEDPFPAELLVDYVTNKRGLREALWRRVKQTPGLISQVAEKDLHLVGRTAPVGRVLLIGGAAVLATAGAGGAILLCKAIYKRHENEKVHKKLHRGLFKK